MIGPIGTAEYERLTTRLGRERYLRRRPAGFGEDTDLSARIALAARADKELSSATATMSGKSAEETREAGTTQEADRLDITVRWSSETAAVNSKQYRVLLDGRIYDILGIDEMGFRHNSRKFFCRLSER